MLSTFQADSLAQAAKSIAPAAQEEKTLSIFKLLFAGGTFGTIIIIITLALLFVALYIYFERIFAIKDASKTDKNFMNQIRDDVANGNIEGAKRLCTQEDSPVARITAKGISRIGSPLEDINLAIENAGKLEVYKLEKRTNIVATVAGVGPMLGFLGTVVGMVIAFYQLSISGGQAEMGQLASGIYSALNTTVVGLITGIVAQICYNHLVAKTDKVINQMESTAVDFIDLLNEPA